MKHWHEFTRFSKYLQKYYLVFLKNTQAFGLQLGVQPMSDDLVHAMPLQRCMFALYVYTTIPMASLSI